MSARLDSLSVFMVFRSHVECVDFSTRITVTFVQIRKHLAFTDIPIQVFRVKLNCLPMYKDWDEYTLDFLQNNINQEPLTAKVLKAGDDKSDPIVSIRLPSSRDAASLLVECGLARKMVI
ncbi:uncharacterized protein LOC111716788 [Eurytemora carolleeae]|uniref:uncharacterized protein LOC111716788 n=1 Tax=Eurytemora carolleeae TaxID=1294199 RepID=UPI000C75602F|nr:uncharacterized protein LOC111716788 [Eurytemora carolleeae]|eukprot:XP_023348041.1 uncharacterized protein LOC111716788 [Eurytemora affinis]